MAQIVGRKLENALVFNMDGYANKDVDPQPLKLLTEKPKKLDQKQKPQQKINDKQTQPEQKQQQSQTPKQQARAKPTRQQVQPQQKTNQPAQSKQKTPSQTEQKQSKQAKELTVPSVQIEPREARKFTPIEVQFPNVINSIQDSTTKIYIRTESDSEERNDDSEYSYQDYDSSDEEFRQKQKLYRQRMAEDKENQNRQPSSQTKGVVPSDPEDSRQILQMKPESLDQYPTRQPAQEKSQKAQKQQQKSQRDLREIKEARQTQETEKQKPNKDYLKSKEQLKREEEQRKKEILDKRKQLSKNYGKELTSQLKSNAQFEQKYPWGQDQSQFTAKEEEGRKKRILKEQDEILKMKQQKKEESLKAIRQLEELFPESRGRRSKYREIWDQEKVKSLSRNPKSASVEKAHYSDSDSKNSPKSTKKKLTEQEIEAVNRKINENAKKLVEDIKYERQKDKQSILLKKHKIDYIDREAKAILKKFKKVPFTGDKPFEAGQNDLLDDDEIINNKPKVKEDDMSQSQAYPRDEGVYSERLGGKILSKEEADRYKIQQQRKQDKIKDLKGKLNNRDIKLKPADSYTAPELKVKQDIKRDQILEEKIDREREKQLRKMQIADQQDKRSVSKSEKKSMARSEAQISYPLISDIVLDEAKIPRPHVGKHQRGRQDSDEDPDFRQEVENEIKKGIFKRRLQPREKSKADPKKLRKGPPKKSVEYEIDELRKIYEIDTDYPPPLELRKRAQKVKEINDRKIRRVYKSQEPKDQAADGRYPLYHDLGETNLLEDDIYNAKYQVDNLWETKPKRMDPNTESDENEEQEFVVRSGFFKDILPFSKTTQKSVRELANKTLKRLQTRNKTVTFQDPGYRTDDSSKFIDVIEESKNNLSQLINKQKKSVMIGKQTTDDDTDDARLLGMETQQIWGKDDPLNRDIFTLSIRQIMDLPELVI